jgi:hypothetical protein
MQENYVTSEHLNDVSISIRSRNFLVDVETRLQVGWPQNRGSISGRNKYYLLQIIHIKSGVHRVFYPMGTMGFFPENKVAEASSWHLISI